MKRERRNQTGRIPVGRRSTHSFILTYSRLEEGTFDSFGFGGGTFISEFVVLHLGVPIREVVCGR